MATTVEPRSETQPYVDADEYIDFQLSKTQSQIKTTEILTSAIWLGLSVLLYLLAFVVLDQWVIPGGFSGSARIAWLGILLVCGGGWGVWRILMPSFRSIHEMYAAKMIEAADPTLKSSLLNLIDLQIHDRTAQSALVRSSMEKRAAVELSKVDVDHAVNQRELQRLAYSLLGAIVVCSLYMMLSPKDAFSSLERFILPMSSTSVATRTNIANVTPEDTKVLAGELLTVEADILGQDPKQVNLVYTTDDREFVNHPVEMVRAEAGVSRFRGIISGEKGRGLMQGITYHIEAGDARTRDYKVQVIEPPSSKVINISYDFPDYMRLDSKVHPGGHIDGWEGTKVVVKAETNIPVQSALLVMTDSENPQAKGEEVRMTITKGKELSAELTLGFRSDGTFARYYHIDCTTAAGESDPLPIVYAIKIQPDQRPDVILLHPTQDLERPANAVVPLLVKAADPDFQLRFVTLRVEKGGEEIHSAALLDEERPVFEGTHDLRLEHLGAGGGALQPGEELIYWVEARDNKQPHGNRSVTPRLKIKISPPAKADEVAKQLEQDRERQQKELEQANPDRNAQTEEQKQAEEQAKENAQQNKPKQPKPQRKPGDPKPPQDPKRPDQEQQTDEQERPNEQGKPEDQPQPGKNKQPGKGDKTKPQPGKQGDQQPQNGEQQKNGTPGKQADAQSGKDDQPGSKDDQSTDEASDAAGGNSKQRKKGPADYEQALKKLIDKEQESNPSNSDEPQPKPEGKQDETGDGTTGENKQDKQDDAHSPKPVGKQPMPKPDRTKPGNSGEKQDESANSDQTENSDQAKPDSQPKGGKSTTGRDAADLSKTEKTQDNKTPRNKGDKNQDDKNQTGKNQTKPEADQAGAQKKPGDKSTTKPEEGPDAGKNQEKQGPGQQNSPMKQTGDKEGETGNQQRMNKTANKDADTPQTQGQEKTNPQGKQPKTKPEGTGKDEGKTPEKPGDKTADMTSEKTDEAGTNPPKPGSKEDAADDKMPPKDPMKNPGGQTGATKDANSDNKAPAKEEGKGGKPGEPMPSAEGEKTENGPGNGQKPGPKSKPEDKPKQPGEESTSDAGQSEESPAESGKDAVKKAATGDETGEAEGQDKPDPEKAPKAKNDVNRKPDSKPGAMRKSDDPPMPGTKGEKSSQDPDATKAKPDGSQRPDEQTPGTNKSSKQPPEKRPGTEASQNEPNPGKGEKNQKSKQPDTGEGGGNTPQDQGTPGSKQKGTGDTQPEEGNQTPDDKGQGGKPGDKPGAGSKTKPGEKGDKPMPGGGESEQPDGENQAGGDQQAGEPKPGAGKPGGQPGKPGEAAPGSQKGGQPGQGAGKNRQPGQGQPGQNQPGNPQGNGAGEPQGERRNLNPAEQTQADEEAAEKANEEFARKASNLVLKKLRKDLDRGEVDQKLLDELGWTKEDMQRFVNRLENQLQDSGDDNSPEAAARRRQFEETLKTLGLSAKTKKRTATSTKKTQAGQLEIRKTAPPPEWQEIYEEYTKELAKPVDSGKK